VVTALVLSSASWDSALVSSASRNFERGAGESASVPRDLSQIHITNYTPFIRGKGDVLKKIVKGYKGRPPRWIRHCR